MDFAIGELRNRKERYARYRYDLSRSGSGILHFLVSLAFQKTVKGEDQMVAEPTVEPLVLRSHDLVRPVIRVCEYRSLIAVVTSPDYERASDEYWARNGVSETFGVILAPTPVFVFKREGPEYALLAQACKVEQARFRVPTKVNKVDDLKKASLHILGRPLEV